MSSSPTHSLPSTAICPDPDRHAALRPFLHAHLMQMSFPAFARCLSCLLTTLGYQQVQVRGATHARGRNAFGAFDLDGYCPSGLMSTRFLAQVKQYRRPVPRAFVDELRGAMLRLGAGQGLILATSAFSPAARQAAQATGLASIRLVDRDELLDLLMAHHLGIRPRSDGSGKWEVDSDFFAGLEREKSADTVPPMTPKASVRSVSKTGASLHGRLSGVSVILTFEPKPPARKPSTQPPRP